MANRIKLRRGTNAEATANNPILALGEIGIITDASSDAVKLKIGDGVTAWNSLPYFVPGSSGGGTWGSITGTLSNQVDLQSALDAKQDDLTFDVTPIYGSSNPVTSDGIYDSLATKQATLVSGTNIKTVGGTTLLGSGDVNVQSELGNIVYNEFLTAGELSSYTNVGAATFSFNVGGGLDVSSGSSTFTSYYKHSWYTLLVDWEITAEFINVSNGNGISFGTPGLFGLIDLNTAGNRGLFYIYGGTTPTLLATASTAMTFTNGDTLRMSLKRAGTYVTLQITNVTTNTKSSPLVYNQTLGLVASNALQSTGNPGIYAYGGSQKVTKFVYSSIAKKRPDLLLIGDSNTEGWCQAYNTVTSLTDGSLNTTYAYRLMAMTNMSMARICRQGAATADINTAINEALLINPKYAIIHIGTNDAISSRTQAQYLADMATLIASLTTAGIIPIICKVIPHVTGAVNTLITSYNTGLATAYASIYTVVETNSNINVTDDTTGVHLNMKGAAKMAWLVADALSNMGAAPETDVSFERYLLNFQTPSAAKRVQMHLYPLNSVGASKGPMVAGRLNNTTSGSEISVLEFWGHISSTTQAMMANLWGARFGIGTSVGVQPVAYLHARAVTLGEEVYRYETTATNDDPYVEMVQGRIATTDATVTTARQVILTASKTLYATALVIARRTAGSAGATDDTAVYELKAVCKGTATLSVNTTTVVYEDQAGWDCVFDISGGALRIRVTGAVNNTITWHVSEFKYSSIGT
ncbi:MAG TPA: GDSL-type esterase/lipase family protein [Bacteroidia bacterium]|jgi:lysophospholipase L1-like esterase|nr:GDSL-type esterase/lipase family protein [Bacteroidia bacterium]